MSVPDFLQDHWAVLMLFLIPVGGGIPGGVLLAESRGLDWPVMMLLYFISDVILAFVFEPIMKGFVLIGRRFHFWGRLNAFFRKAVERSTAHYGPNLGPIALILVAFGVDPMTGRAAAAAAGHGFIAGWAIAITGDMMYFSVLMVSTLWLNDILGDGTVTMFAILALMIVVPAVVRRVREGLKTVNEVPVKNRDHSVNQITDRAEADTVLAREREDA